MKPSNQGLSKHLYRIDEVLSSLRWSIITHNVNETAFWAIEVYQSNLLQEALETLETIWLTNIGFGSWYALRLILFVYEEGELSEEEWIEITCAFAKVRICDSTIFHLLLRGSITSEWTPAFPHSQLYQGPKDAVLDCLKRGKLQEAWFLGRSMEISEQWQLLEYLAIELDRSSELLTLKTLRSSSYECLATAYVLVCLDHITWLSSQKPLENHIPDEVTAAIKRWSSETSMRKRRAIKPRMEALLYLTDRSHQSQVCKDELQIHFEDTLKRSPYWSDVLSDYMENGEWISDRNKEEFYDTHFPDDIPDEWSLADREMSHGHGLGKPIEQSRPRFIHHTLQHSKSLEIWDSSFPPNTDSSMEWDPLYSEIQKKSNEILKFPMMPFKKVFKL